MTTALATLTSTLAAKLDMGDGADLIETLKATAFKGQVSDAQMTALMVVANQYGLNPWVKEIYAFPDRQNGIVPVVGVDGWARIINTHPQFDGMDFEQDSESCTCTIYRKDRSRPVRVTEFMSECKRGTGPWQSHPRRMLRHKAMIQCARLAFGYGGIYDQDEAERIVESVEPRHMGAAQVVEPPHHYPAADFDKNVGAWAKVIADGKKTEAQIVAMVQTKGKLTDEQRKRLRDEVKRLAAPVASAAEVIDNDTGEIVVTYAHVADKLNTAKDLDRLAEAASLISAVADGQQRQELSEMYDRLGAELEGVQA